MTAAQERTLLAEYAASDNAIYLVAEVEGHVVGCLSCTGGKRRRHRCGDRPASTAASSSPAITATRPRSKARSCPANEPPGPYSTDSGTSAGRPQPG